MVDYLWDGEMDCGWESLGEKVTETCAEFVNYIQRLLPCFFNEETINLITHGRAQESKTIIKRC